MRRGPQRHRDPGVVLRAPRSGGGLRGSDPADLGMNAASRSVSRVLYAPCEQGAWRPSIYDARRRAPRAVYPQTRAGRPQTSARSGQPPAPSRPCSGWGLPSRPRHRGRWCALTAPFHPYRPGRGPGGGLFSVALSRGSPRVGVTNHPALWSPDFPRTRRSPGVLAAARPTRRDGKCSLPHRPARHRRSSARRAGRSSPGPGPGHWARGAGRGLPGAALLPPAAASPRDGRGPGRPAAPRRPAAPCHRRRPRASG